MGKNGGGKRTDQMDAKALNLIALKKIGKKLVDVSTALIQIQLVTGKLAQAVDIVAKRYAVLQAEGIDKQLANKDK